MVKLFILINNVNNHFIKVKRQEKELLYLHKKFSILSF